MKSLFLLLSLFCASVGAVLPVPSSKESPMDVTAPAEPEVHSSPGCSGCLLTHFPTNTTCGCIVSISWGVGSTAGVCPTNCSTSSECNIGAFVVTVTGECWIELMGFLGWGTKQHLNGSVDVGYGSASDPFKLACGHTVSYVRFPDCGTPPAEGGIKCTACQ